MLTEKPAQDHHRDQKVKTKSTPTWVWDLIMVVILILAAVFRFTGIAWDENQHLHPDERFLTMVETAISPVSSSAEYFDSANSSLNPNNHGYTFYVYGSLPLFIVAYVGEWLGMTGYDEINIVGRVLSSIFDLGTIVFIYLIGRKLYRHARLGLLAALFSALVVLQIQLSHYFTVDNFANFFTYGAIFVAVCIATNPREFSPGGEENTEKSQLPRWLTKHWDSSVMYILFGILYGMALASKVSVWALAALLPLAAWLYYRKLPAEKRDTSFLILVRNVIVAAIIAFLTFRICQPYSFIGPGFFGLKLNSSWLASLRELATIQKGDVDVPYALQWARRPVTFTVKNLVLWGMGIPLGVLSLAGLVWMTWRIIKGDWQKHLLLWGWTAFILVSQSISSVKSMRYIISIYPALALIASWTIFKLFEDGSTGGMKIRLVHINWKKLLAISALVITLAGTVLWAFAFTTIYTKPVTRVAASDWIYENIPAAINFKITTMESEEINQPAAYQNGALISYDAPYRYVFSVEEEETLSQVSLQYVLNQTENAPQSSLLASVSEVGTSGASLIGAGFVQSNFIAASDANGDLVEIVLQQPVTLEKGKQYQLEFSVAEPEVFLRIAGTVTLDLDSGPRYLTQPVYRITQNSPYQLLFYPRESGTLTEVSMNRVVDLTGVNQTSTLKAAIIDSNNMEITLSSGELTESFSAKNDPRGETKTIQLDKPVALEKNTGYYLFLYMEGSGELGIYNSVTAVESTWDDALPVNSYGYNVFGFQDGIYGNHLNLELYWDDNAEKLDRLTSSLEQADALFISSNRQWGTIPRVPERYPLTTEYYRALIGCPEEKDILWCYSVAEPGMFQGELGFELTAVFQNDPVVGKFRFNDQFAEEAFTVYDHPKVLIFEKSSSYDPEKVKEILGAVNLADVVHKTPRQASQINGNLMLTEEESATQTAGGTWVELFPPDSPLNKYPWLAAVTWYMTVMMLGWIVYPLVRFFFKGLSDHGYAFSRLTGMLLLAYFTWLMGSAGIPFSRTTISIVLLVMLLVGVGVAVLQRRVLFKEIEHNKRNILIVEGLMLAFFLLDLAIRIGNPDLWHPWKGGEKPMDLSYFTAVLKSTTFPPYDPWYSGGYINYYYYGYVIVGVLVKLLGIEPSIAYNLILPTLFALTGIGAFSIGWNIFSKRPPDVENDADADRKASDKRSFLAGLASSLAVLIAGNLGTVRMLWQGLVRLGSPDGMIDGARVFESIGWFFSGLGKFITGANLQYGYGEWYWNPSRAIPGDVITEFPFFTFTYADLHAHMIALPITLLVLGWTFSVLFRKWEPLSSKSLRAGANMVGTILFGGFIIGTLRPTNTWDLPTYLLFAAIVLFYSTYKNARLPAGFFPVLPQWLRRIAFSGIMVGILVVGVLLFYLPFTQKYGQAYGSVTAWKGDHTPLGSYLVHWGWQLFLITTWLVWETREWLAATPASAIRKIKPYLGYLQVIGLLLLLVLVLLSLLGISIGWLVGLLGVWAVVLLLRPDQPDSKRMVLFMIGTGLLLTLFVELVVLEGDIGRMNTVFKFYYQAWTLLSIGAAASLMWVIPAVKSTWKAGISNLWQVVLVLLVFGAFLYPVTASADKIRDRISAEAPTGLDGDAYMQTSYYNDQGVDMDLNQDYQAIQWMRMNVKGSPVIVEANTVEYRWGNRFTIYTGLPGVLGWNWHQRQQRGFLSYNSITNRLNEIPYFYQTTLVEDALSFLEKNNVSYFILGQMERAYYSGPGLDKFEDYDGVYWKEVFRVEDTVIYEVIH